MPTQEQEWNAPVIAEFRQNGGEVAAPYDNPPPMLLLHTIGARSGREHIVPLRTRIEGDALYVFGSAHGSARHPDWYRNVLVNPDFPVFADYEQKLERTIPVLKLERQR